MLEKAEKISPDSAAIALALSKVWQELGFISKSLAQAQQALKLSATLDQEERLKARARVAELSGKSAEAAGTYASLWAFFPDNPEYALALVRTRLGSGQASKAMETIAQLRGLPGPAASDPRIDLAEATVAGVLGNFERQLELASGAKERSLALGARQLVAESLGQKVIALTRLGRVGQAEKDSLEEEKIYRAVHNENGVAHALHRRAILAYKEGRMEDALQLFEESLKVFKKLGAAGSIAEVYNGLGGVQLARGDVKGAEEYFKKGLALYEKTEDRDREARILGNLAVLAQHQGDFSRSIDLLEQARAILRELDAKDREAIVIRNIAATYYGRGDLIEARRAFEQAVALDRETGNQSELAGTLFALGDLLNESAEFSESRKRFEESRSIAAKIKDGQQEAKAEFGKVVVLCEQYLIDFGKRKAPLKELREVTEKLRKAEVKDSLILARLYQARIQESEGDLAAAAKTVDSFGPMLEEVPDAGTRLAARMGVARLKFLQGKAPEAIEELSSLLTKVEGSGVSSLGYQLRLVLGEAELKLPQSRKKGRRRLEELRSETQARGWRLLGRKIDRILSEE